MRDEKSLMMSMLDENSISKAPQLQLLKVGPALQTHFLRSVSEELRDVYV